MRASPPRSGCAAVALFVVVFLLGGGGPDGGSSSAMLAVRAEKIVLLFGIYPARAADFGMEVPDDAQINVLYAPVGSNNSLCDYPFDEDENATADDLRAFAPAFNVPIALLLDSSDRCGAERQALVARKIQRRIEPKIQYVIIQGKPEDGDYLHVLSPDGEDVDGVLGDSIGVLYITYRTGSFVQQHVARRQSMWGGSPYLMDPSGRNFEWSLITNIEKYTPPNRDGGSNGSGSRSNDSFYWFRVLLFTLLIVSPCARAGYLWWVGGGRIQFRRNENGRITGLQYIPPMPYWLSNGMGPGGHQFEPASTTLNEEQFNLLPEIIFQPDRVNKDDDGDDVNNDNNNNATTDDSDGDSSGLYADAREDETETEVGTGDPIGRDEERADEDIEQPGTTSSATAGTGQNSSSTEVTTGSAPAGNGDGDDDHPDDDVIVAEANAGEGSGLAPAAPDSAPESAVNISTTCTVCSICIDDFEPGEKLILLPRCQHAFHRDCIFPWLTERQGTCPLCKTYVIESDEPNEEDEDVEDAHRYDEEEDDEEADTRPGDRPAIAPDGGAESGSGGASPEISQGAADTEELDANAREEVRRPVEVDQNAPSRP